MAEEVEMVAEPVERGPEAEKKTPIWLIVAGVGLLILLMRK